VSARLNSPSDGVPGPIVEDDFDVEVLSTSGSGLWQQLRPVGLVAEQSSSRTSWTSAGFFRPRTRFVGSLMAKSFGKSLDVPNSQSVLRLHALK